MDLVKFSFLYIISHKFYAACVGEVQSHVRNVIYK